MESDKAAKRWSSTEIDNAWEAYRKHMGGRTSLKAEAEKAAFYAGAVAMLVGMSEILHTVADSIRPPVGK